MVDTYYFNKKNRATGGSLPLMYWGKYVQHDNNRDGMGQFLDLTQNVDEDDDSSGRRSCCTTCTRRRRTSTASTGTGPYNEALDPITIDEWWMLAENDVMEMTKRGVPGVWTYGFYDGWVPNYMFFIAHAHNAIGRFYEVQSYGPDPYDVRRVPRPRAASGSAPTRRSTPSTGARATTPTSRSRRCSSPSSTSRTTARCSWRTTG